MVNTLDDSSLPPGDSEIYIHAERIRLATDFLVREHGYSLEHLRNLTGGGDREGNGAIEAERLHKNSILKIKELKPVWMIWKKRLKGYITTEDPQAVGDDGQPAHREWLWNPQADTFERLELIVLEAKRLGFHPPRPNRRVRFKVYAAVPDDDTPPEYVYPKDDTLEDTAGSHEADIDA